MSLDTTTTLPNEASSAQNEMKFFKLVRSGMDVKPLVEEIQQQEDAWLQDTSRQTKIQVQRDTNTIFIRRPVRRPDLNVNENQECRSTGLSVRFPKALALMTSIASDLNAELSRATIVRLKPGSRVYQHIDAGSYYLIRDRYHLVVQSSTGSILSSANEIVRMQAGELWWFNNKQYHESSNDSKEWRIHYIFDLLPPAYKALAVNAMLPSQPSDPK